MDTTNRRLVAVFPDRQSAERAVEDAVGAGARRSDIRIGEEMDERAAMRGEMRQELEGSFVSAQGAFAYPKEAWKGGAVMTLLCAAACAVLLMLLAPFVLSGLGLGLRLLILGGIGLVAGSTIGIIVGPGFSAKGPNEPMATERGVTVSLPLTDHGLEDVFRNAGAIRVDEVTTEGEPIINLTAEGDGKDRGPVERMTDDLTDDKGGSVPFNRR